MQPLGLFHFSRRSPLRRPHCTDEETEAQIDGSRPDPGAGLLPLAATRRGAEQVEGLRLLFAVKDSDKTDVPESLYLLTPRSIFPLGE